MKLDKDRDYSVIVVSSTADSDRRGTSEALRRMGCLPCTCAWCGASAMIHPSSRNLMPGVTELVTCMRCLGVAADQMDNLDEPTRERFRNFTRTYEEEMDRA